MIVTRPHTYNAVAREAAVLLGITVRAARRERRWTVEELAERVGVSPNTIRKVERGDLSVSLGTAFEAASLLGLPLFADDPTRRRGEIQRLSDRLAVLPRPGTSTRPVRDDF